MKRMIRRRLCMVILTAMLLTLFLNYFVQIQSARSGMYEEALDNFKQIGGFWNRTNRTRPEPGRN